MRENKITRKIFTLLCVLTLIVGLSILNIPVCAEEIPQDRQLPRLVDDADLLTDSEEQELNTELDEISEKQQCDVVVVTENSLDGKSAQDYALIIMDMDTVMKTALFCFLLGWTNGNGQLLHTAMVSLHLRIMDWNIWKMSSCLI